MRLRTAFTVIAALLGGSVLSWAQQSDLSRPVIRDAHANGQEQVIRANDNRNRAGKLENGVLRLHLVMAQGMWYPETDGHEPLLQVPVFGEEGGPLTNPGPLIRVPEGTELHISVRNLYHKPLFVHGLGEGPTKNSLRLEPGETHEFSFHSGPAGTYEYWANLQDKPMFARGAEASQLTGAFIERVSILLGHQSTRVIEKHYNPWVRSRQEQLEADLERAWRRDPQVLVEAKVTRRLRGERERLN